MKRLIFLLIFFIATPCFAVDGVSGVNHPAKVNSVVTPDKVCGVSGLATAACATAKDSCAGNEDSGQVVGSASTTKYIASMFVADANTTICAASLTLKKVGSPTFNMVVQIWANTDTNADNPADYTDDLPTAAGLIGTGSGSVAASGVNDAAYESVSFTGMSAAITAGTIYWVVIITSATQDASNNILWGLEATGCVGDNEEVASDNDGASWSKSTSSVAAEFQLYSN